MSAIIGFKNGFFKSLISFVGFILVVVLAYEFKNIIGDFFVLNLPFLDFETFFGASTLNIIMYQMFALMLTLIIFGLVYKVIVTLTGVFEKVLKMTIILGIPSKLLGMVVGLLEGYIILYLVLFFLTQPFWSFNIFENSDYAKPILEKTPLLSGYAEKSLEVFTEIKDLAKKDYKENIDVEIANIILKDKITSPEIMRKLVESGKIKIDGIEEIIKLYE